jgi:hypothetical protein
LYYFEYLYDVINEAKSAFVISINTISNYILNCLKSRNNFEIIDRKSDEVLIKVLSALKNCLTNDSQLPSETITVKILSLEAVIF